jgi:cyclopropane fatty-acyl-phospholipid synthase-like methyltransferase
MIFEFFSNTMNIYHQQIAEYYRQTQHAYKDAWKMDQALSIHYGYWDNEVKSFAESLLRMNEVMMDFAGIKKGDKVLDAGCGVGGSAIFLAGKLECSCIGITLSDVQLKQAEANAKTRNVEQHCSFQLMDYCNTDFNDESFDIVWGLESICYAPRKEDFIKEACRLLRPGGRLIIADGMVVKKEFNNCPVMRKWLDGWAVNYLETPEGFREFFSATGLKNIQYKNITPFVQHSSVRLRNIAVAATLYGWWLKITGKNNWTDIQYGNISAAWHQYFAMKKKLWGYGMIVGTK